MEQLLSYRFVPTSVKVDFKSDEPFMRVSSLLE
jgi:hypothetical protein